MQRQSGRQIRSDSRDICIKISYTERRILIEHLARERAAIRAVSVFSVASPLFLFLLTRERFDLYRPRAVRWIAVSTLNRF